MFIYVIYCANFIDNLKDINNELYKDRQIMVSLFTNNNYEQLEVYCQKQEKIIKSYFEIKEESDKIIDNLKNNIDIGFLSQQISLSMEEQIKRPEEIQIKLVKQSKDLYELYKHRDVVEDIERSYNNLLQSKKALLSNKMKKEEHNYIKQQLQSEIKSIDQIMDKMYLKVLKRCSIAMNNLDPISNLNTQLQQNEINLSLYKNKIEDEERKILYQQEKERKKLQQQEDEKKAERENNLMIFGVFIFIIIAACLGIYRKSNESQSNYY